jgi:hypothetical protein
MQPPQNRALARQQSTESHPQNKQRVQEKDGSRKYRIKIASETSRAHH